MIACVGKRLASCRGHLVVNGLLETETHAIERNALHYRVEKAFHHQTLGFPVRDATRLEVEERFLFKFSDRRAVATAHIIGQDLQAGDRIGARPLAEDQVAVGLVTVGLLRCGAT